MASVVMEIRKKDGSNEHLGSEEQLPDDVRAIADQLMSKDVQIVCAGIQALCNYVRGAKNE